MTDHNMSIDRGSTVAAQRWVELLREHTAARRARVDPGHARPSARVDSTPIDTARSAPERPDRVPGGRRDGRVAEESMRARAAVGELEVQRATYEGIRHVIDETGSTVRARVERAEAAVADARAADSRAAADARARQADADAAVRAAHDAFAEAGDRLQALRREARAAAADAVARANALSEAVAGDNRDARSGRIRADRVDDATRRADSLRELARLTGAEGRSLDDGTAEVTLGGRALVAGGTAGTLRLVEPSPRPTTAQEATRVDVRAGETAPTGREDRVSGSDAPAPHPAAPSATEPRAEEPRASDPRAPESRSPEAYRQSPRVEGDPAVGAAPGASVSGASTARAFDLGLVDPRTLDPLAPDPRDLDPRALVAGATEGPRPGPASTVADGAAGRAASADSDEVALAWADGEPVPTRLGTIGALIDAAEEVVPAVQQRLDEVARAFGEQSGTGAAGDTGWTPAFTPLPGVAAGLAASAADTDSAVVVPGPEAGDAVGSGTPVVPGAGSVSSPVGATPAGTVGDTVATLLAGLSASLGRAQEVIDRQLDIVASVDAVLSGPPATQVGGMAAAAVGGTAAVPPLERGRQDLISALQEVGARLLGLEAAAAEVLGGEPLAPVRFTSTRPDLLRLEVAPGPAGGAELPGASTVVTGAGQAEAFIHSIAAGGAIASQATFAPGAVLGGGAAFDVLVVTGVGEADREVGTRLHLGPGSRLPDVAAAVEAADLGLFAQVVRAGDGERLQVASTSTGAGTGVALVDSVRTGTPPAALGAFGLLQAPTDTVVEVSGVTRDAMRLSSPTPFVDGPVEGLRLAAGAAAVGASVGIGWRPDAERGAQRVEGLTAAAASFLDASTGREARSGLGTSAFAADPMMQTLSERVAAALGAGPRPGGEPLPGVRVDRARPVFEREPFLRAIADDPVGTEAAVRSAARELAAVVREAVDPRLGALAVRIHGELEAARGSAVGGADVDDRMGYRPEELERRTEALQSLLDRLDGERSWLDGRLA